MSTVTLATSFEISHGANGVDADSANPIARATHRLLQSDGQPFKRLTLTFLGNDQGPTVDRPLRWFGVFVLTHGDRILFFPGTPRLDPGVRVLGPLGQEAESHMQADHATLERDWCSWHATDQGSVEHAGEMPTCDLGHRRRLWFGLSIQAEDALRVTQRTTTVQAEVPELDADRRTKVLTAAREDAVFQELRVNENSGLSSGASFLHFAVIVGPGGFELYRGNDLGIPFDSPLLSERPPLHLRNVNMRLHRFPLSRDVDIQITTMSLPGQVSSPLAFTSQTRPGNTGET
jgi:hypothetical protein